MKYHAHAIFWLSLHNVHATTLPHSFLYTTMKCKADWNLFITCKVWEGFGTFLKIFKNIFFLHLWSIRHTIHASNPSSYTIVWRNPWAFVVNLGNSYFLLSSENIDNFSLKIVGYPSRKGVDQKNKIHSLSGGIPNDFLAQITHTFRWDQKITVT